MLCGGASVCLAWCLHDALQITAQNLWAKMLRNQNNLLSRFKISYRLAFTLTWFWLVSVFLLVWVFFSCLIISSIVTADENVHFKLDLARLQYGPRCSCLVLCIFFNSIKCPEKVRKYNVWQTEAVNSQFRKCFWRFYFGNELERSE